jgi:4-hydroxy-3-polyprenylbenzoate decarboxylase
VLADGPADHLDHATATQFLGGKLGIDATAKLPAEGAREWPPEIEMSDEVRELVDRRWQEYGIGAALEAQAAAIRHSLGKLLRR